MSKLLLAGLALTFILGGAVLFLHPSSPQLQTNVVTTKAQHTPIPTKISPTPGSTPNTSPPVSTGAYITSSPVDLTQIAQISKYRSCEGHDSSGYNADGILESNRSMKHYLLPIESLRGSLGKVKVFAPFDGILKSSFPESSTHGNQLAIKSSTNPDWSIILYHIDSTLPVGTKVTSGDLVGYASLGVYHNSFDIGLAKEDANMDAKMEEFIKSGRRPDSFSEKDKLNDNKRTFDSFLNQLSPPVKAAFASRGITTDSAIFSKADRDAEPCNFGSRPLDPKSWVILK